MFFQALVRDAFPSNFETRAAVQDLDYPGRTNFLALSKRYVQPRFTVRLWFFQTYRRGKVWRCVCKERNLGYFSMASENSEDSSVVVSEESSYKCDTVSPESPDVQINSAKPSPRKSPRMSAAFGTYLNKVIAKGSRAFYGTGSEASDNESVCDAELIGKAAHALSEDINERIRVRVGSCSPTPGEHEPTADSSVISEGKESLVCADNETSSPVKLDQASNSQPESEERSAQTITSEEKPNLENIKRPDFADTATQSLETEPSAEAPAKPEDSNTGRPAADPDLLKDRERQLEERVRLLKERKSSARKPSSNLDGSFVEQLKKIDLGIDGGTLKICDRNLSENGTIIFSI